MMAVLGLGLTLTLNDVLFVNDLCFTGHNKMVQQTSSWQAIYMRIFVVKIVAGLSLY